MSHYTQLPSYCVKADNFLGSGGAFTLSTEDAEVGGTLSSEASQINRVSSRTASATQRNLVGEGSRKKRGAEKKVKGMGGSEEN